MKRKLLTILLLHTAFGFFPFGCVSSDLSKQIAREEAAREVAELREELVREGLLSAERTAEAPRGEDEWVSKEELKREVMDALQNQGWEKPSPDAASPGDSFRARVGSAQGKVLLGGKGVEGCRIRMIKITRLGGFLSERVEEGEEFEAVTDEDGAFRFARLPVGGYRLKWLLPGSNGWIRRLSDKPDAIVERDRTSQLKTINAGRAPVAN